MNAFRTAAPGFLAAPVPLGARAELVTYPYEAHGYAARGTLLDCVARMIDWYDRDVKNAGAPQPAASH